MPTLDDDYVTVAEAATLLRVHPSTIRRWIRQGDVLAYRIGRRRLALKRVDLTKQISPVLAGEEIDGEMSSIKRLEIPLMTPEEQQRGFAAVESAKRLQAEFLERRGGEPFSPSWEIINELRDERSRQLS